MPVAQQVPGVTQVSPEPQQAVPQAFWAGQQELLMQVVVPEQQRVLLLHSEEVGQQEPPTQEPAWVLQVVPQEPQFELLVLVSTQAPEQTIWPELQLEPQSGAVGQPPGGVRQEDSLT